MLKLYLSTEFPHQEIRWNYGILRILFYVTNWREETHSYGAQEEASLKLLIQERLFILVSFLFLVLLLSFFSSLYYKTSKLVFFHQNFKCFLDMEYKTASSYETNLKNPKLIN